MSKSQSHQSKGIAPTTTDAPRTAIRDVVLAEVSANVDDADVIDGLLWLVEEDCATASITGPGRMVGFHDYNGVQL